jgi:mannose-6-phosphate isomerase-like protein (cupin superfamily)
VITESELFNYISSSYPYEQKDISVIDNLGRQIIVDDFPQLLKMRMMPYTVKIESMEKYSHSFFNKAKKYAKLYNHYGPITCHLFWARENDYSFSEHEDLDDVIIHCAQGIKHMIIEGIDSYIEAGQHILIPAGVKHRALNTTGSIMLSFGLERFSIEKAI